MKPTSPNTTDQQMEITRRASTLSFYSSVFLTSVCSAATQHPLQQWSQDDLEFNDYAYGLYLCRKQSRLKCHTQTLHSDALMGYSLDTLQTIHAVPGAIPAVRGLPDSQWSWEEPGGLPLLPSKAQSLQEAGDKNT